MKKRHLFLYSFLIIIVSLKAQNLVPNPSFEIDSACPPNTGYINFSPPWYAVTIGTPDYFNICDEGGNAGIPHNEFGFQYARTGSAYTGVFTKEYNNIQYREYICAPLFSTLSNGTAYYVSMFVNCPNVNIVSTNWSPSDRIGIYLSNGPPDTIGTSSSSAFGYGYIHQIPQIENPAGNLLNDTVNWVQISGWFTASGGENYITIGNFRSDLLTTMGGDSVSYYYIDDVCVSTDSATCALHSNVSIKKNLNSNNSSVYPNPIKKDATLSFSNPKNQSCTLTLYDTQGLAVATINIITSNKVKISADNLQSGLYYYVLRAKDYVLAKGKLVVE